MTVDDYCWKLEFLVDVYPPKEQKQGEHDEHRDLKPVWKDVSADNGCQDIRNLARVLLHHIVEILQYPEKE